MKRKTTVQLTIIVPALLILGIATWIGINMLVGTFRTAHTRGQRPVPGAQQDWG